MRKMLSWMVLGVLSSVSLAQAQPVQYPELKCFLKDKGWNQHKDLRCRVWVNYCVGGKADKVVCPEISPDVETNEETNVNFAVKCSDGFKLRSEDYAFHYGPEAQWFNADSHGKLATLRVEQLVPTIEDSRQAYEADLIIANRITRHLEGRCWFEGNEPAPPPIE